MDNISEGQWFHSYMQTTEANKITQGEGITIAVIDTGVDASHPDLSSSIVAGTDFVDQTDGRSDTNGHGTAMAGLAVARGRVAGVAPKAHVMPVRVAIVDLGGSASLAQGIIWAAQHGAKVISISRGSPSQESRLDFAIQEAAKADAVVVAAVGNKPNDSSVIYPAAIPGVLAVASIGKDGNRAPNSVTGPEVMIAAPGDGISSTRPNNGYGVTNGTSNATAIVAGAVALIRAKYPQLKAQDVIKRITATATDKGAPGRDPEYGFGVLNLMAALTADVPTQSATPGTTSSPITTPPAQPKDSKPFPWWLIVVPVVVIIGATAVGIAIKRRQTS
ncbi:S8 family serine peptidase [Catelliglobosispora koreensis]|uniref:S8 family serine peptidase n=1 Tax=Catelliglobosispora koreensis TaxID=129052 RepID=UPI0012FAA1C7|nr:S8 family serine peptidase [Catelliglobosispora koreensis]